MSEHQLVLLDAIEKGHTSIVLKLLRNQISLNVTDIYGRTPLMIAAKNGRNDIVKILLEHIGTTNIEIDHGGKTALHYAAENSELSTVKTLCKSQPSLMTTMTTQTQLLPLDYALLADEDIYPALNRYTQGGEVSAGESDNDDDDDGPKAGIYVKKKKKKGSGKKKKGGKKSGSKKKKKGGKKKK